MCDIDLTGVDLRSVDLSGADLSVVVGLAESIYYGTTLYDDYTDFSDKGFDPVVAGWTLATASGALEAVTMGQMKSGH